jgi:2-phosphosulfolactate phosphatase
MPVQDLPVLEVCLSPALLHLFDTKDKVVVIIDVFRATSTIAAALHNGAKCVIPVASVEECIAIGNSLENSLTAGERDGKVADGLEHGNSPLEYPREFIDQKNLVLTTTNGTRLLHMVKDADTIITGAFLNLSAVCEFLIAQGKSVVLGCAAWKDRFNLEDSLFAGAVVSKIKEHFVIHCDSARACNHLYESSKGNLLEFLTDSSHYRRLSGFGLLKDLEYCTTPDLHPVVPILKGRELVIHQ